MSKTNYCLIITVYVAALPSCDGQKLFVGNYYSGPHVLLDMTNMDFTEYTLPEYSLCRADTDGYKLFFTTGALDDGSVYYLDLSDDSAIPIKLFGHYNDEILMTEGIGVDPLNSRIFFSTDTSRSESFGIESINYDGSDLQTVYSVNRVYSFSIVVDPCNL